MYLLDIHTHSIASGHGSTDTISDLARAAADRGLKLLGVSDHAPSTMCAGTTSYFRGLAMAPRRRLGVELLYGVELNILDYAGHIDLDTATLSSLDYAIASIHRPNLRPGSIEQNTSAYIGAMKNPYVSVIGHCDDTRYPVDYRALVEEAVRSRVLLEINNSSLSPDGYRGDTRDNIRRILQLCQAAGHPVLLSSDSHGKKHVGDFSCADLILRELHFPEELVINHSCAALKRFLVRE